MKRRVKHINKRDDFTKSIDIEEFKDQFNIFKADHKKAIKRKVNQLSKNKQRVENEDKVREQQRKWREASITRQRAADESKVKEDQNKRKKVSIVRQR